MLQAPGRALDLAGANPYGQQLFFANMVFKRRRTPRLEPPPHDLSWRPSKRPSKNTRRPRPGTGFDAAAWVQLTLFDMAADPEVVRERALVEDNDLTRYCVSIVLEHAERFGWSARQRNDVTHSLRLLQTLRTTPTAKIRATEVLQLRRYGGNIISTIDVLAAADLLIDDRPTRLETYFNTKTSALPPVMKQQLEVWLQITAEGATTPPRQRARDPQTVRLQILGITPIIQAWAEAGHQSLAEITPEQILRSLPEKGAHRYLAELGLRSLFKALKARKLIFADPTRGMPAPRAPSNAPLPLDTAAIRQELNNPDPVIALAVALVAFHALTDKQVRQLRLTDIVDGRLTLGDRDIPLAAPVRTRLAAWLDHRNRTWPNSQNPYLIINRRTAPRLIPAGRQYPWKQATLRSQELREDRILSEIHAAGGDIRRICDLFGLSMEGASRYHRTVEHPDLTIEGERVPPT